MSFSQRDFRDALGRFATGVTVVTARHADGRLVGVTVNSFTSVSLDPPLILFCLDREAASLAAFQDVGRFAVNILAEGQEELSVRFAAPLSDRWDGVATTASENGSPALDSALATLDCDLDRVVDGGDHLILIGRVTALRESAEGQRPLVYFRGQYRGLAPAD